MKKIIDFKYYLINLLIALIYVYVDEVIFKGTSFFSLLEPPFMLIPFMIGTLIFPFIISLPLFFLLKSFSKFKEIKFSLIFLILTTIMISISVYGKMLELRNLVEYGV